MVFIFLAYFTLYNGLQFHPSHENWFKWVLFNGWVIFHGVYIPQLPYPFVCWWASRLLPCSGYYKQAHNVLFVPSKCLWWVWGLTLNTIASPTILWQLLICPWLWGIFFWWVPPFSCWWLLQQLVAILVLLEEEMSTQQIKTRSWLWLRSWTPYWKIQT